MSSPSFGSKMRKVANWAIPIILFVTYFKPLFGDDPTPFVGDLSPSEPGSDPVEIWNATPPTARGLGPQLAGWCYCWVTCMVTFLVGAPDEKTHILLARSNAIIMLVVWPIIWYGAMLPKADYAPMNFETYLYDMSIGEIVMGIVFLYTGWFVPPFVETETKED